jgi:hypothetical protein
MMEPTLTSPAMSKRDDTARLIYGRAEELAQTGHYGGWTEIEAVLVREGHADANRHLSSKAKRHWLDMLCARHQKKTPDKH